MAKRPAGGTKGKSGQGKGGKKKPSAVGADRPKASDAFDTPEKAFAEAERLIAEAQGRGATELTVQLRYLASIPASIAGLTALQRLSLDNTQVADLAPLAGLTALQDLWLSGSTARRWRTWRRSPA